MFAQDFGLTQSGSSSSGVSGSQPSGPGTQRRKKSKIIPFRETIIIREH